MQSELKQKLTLAHSPDADDAFMFYAITRARIDLGPYEFVHVLADIESLNRAALTSRYDLTAISLHAYAYVHHRYLLLDCGASVGEGYGPVLVARADCLGKDPASLSIAIPGTWTTAFLVLRLFLSKPFHYVEVPFEKILDAVNTGHFDGKPVEAGLVIHEGQLTYSTQGLHLVADLGRWWQNRTGLPLPLGLNAVRATLPPPMHGDLQRLLRNSIRFALENREEALDFAQQFARGLDRAALARFVDMYVNRWTVTLGEQGREAVAALLEAGYHHGLLPEYIEPRFVEVIE